MAHAHAKPLGSFRDFERLFDQLDPATSNELRRPFAQLEKQPAIELAKSLPSKKFGRCPSLHNQGLLGRRS